jgi:hypothetical protein
VTILEIADAAEEACFRAEEERARDEIAPG